MNNREILQQYPVFQNWTPTALWDNFLSTCFIYQPFHGPPIPMSELHCFHRLLIHEFRNYCLRAAE